MAIYLSYEEMLKLVHDVRFFAQEDEYQGRWVAVVMTDHGYRVITEYFGSCSGCDAIEAGQQNGDLETEEDYRKLCLEEYSNLLTPEEYFAQEKWDSNSSSLSGQVRYWLAKEDVTFGSLNGA